MKRTDMSAIPAEDSQRQAARRKAALAAALLLLTGGALGVTVDRVWLLPSAVETMPLTARAMAERLDLTNAEEERVHALLDSLHAELMSAAPQGADSLRVTTHRVQSRLEQALPAAARAEFRTWMHEHHQQLRERMHGAGAHVSGATHQRREH